MKDDDILALYLLKLEISLNEALKLLSVGSAAAVVVPKTKLEIISSTVYI